MANEEFHNIRGVSFIDRESFNNAILLLTMIKSDYYYIVGFSRPKNTIKIAFDFETQYFTKVTEYIQIEFSELENRIKITSEIQNVNVNNAFDEYKQIVKSGSLMLINNKLIYTMFVDKDSVFPESIRDMNNTIKCAIKDIKEIISHYYNISIKE